MADRKTAHLFVVPEGELYRLSFAALPNAERGYLIDSGVNVHTLAQESDLTLPAAVRAAPTTLLAGAADFATRKSVAAGASRQLCLRAAHEGFAPIPQAGRELPWSANAKLTLDEFPLNAIPAAADQRVRGHVTGQISLDDMHKDAKVKGLLELNKLAVAGVKYEKGRVQIDIGGGKALGLVRIDQKDGYVEYSPEKYGILQDTGLVVVDAANGAEAKPITSNPVFASLPAAQAGNVATRSSSCSCSWRSDWRRSTSGG